MNSLIVGRSAFFAGRFIFNNGAGARLWLAVVLATLASALAPLPGAAADITWGTPMTISGDTDVSANGNAQYAYFLGSANQTVNGVTFTAASGSTAWGNVGFSSAFTGTGSGFAVSAYINPSTSYSNVLTGGAYGSAAAGTVTLNGLTANEAYAVQIWVNDSRSAGSGRSEIVSNSVASTATLVYNDFSAFGGVGQYVIGTFVANSSSNSFTLIPSAGGSVQLNAISVRDLGGPNKIWLGNSDTSWGTAANWSPSGAPISDQSVIFNNLSTANFATMLDVSHTVGTLSLSNAPSAVSIGSDGNTLTINAGLNLFGAGDNLTINDPVVLGGFQTWTNNGAVTVNAPISGSAGLTLAGTGIMTITQPATYLYKTAISGGTLVLSGSGSIAGGKFAVGGGATFDVSAESPNFALAGRDLSNISSGAIINGANDCTSGSLSLTYDGANPCFIQTNGAMTISSATVVNINIPGGSLSAGSHTLIAAATTGNAGQVTVSGTLPSVLLTGNGAVGAASLAVDGSGNLNLVIATPDVWTGAVNGNWSNGGNWIPGNEPNPADSILFNSSSTANLNISQDDTVAGGVIYGLSLVDPAGPVTIGGPGNLTVYGGGLNLSSANQNLTVAAPLIINATQNWLVTNSRTLTISGPVSSVSGGNVTVSGGGTLKMGAAHVLDNLTNNAGTCDFTVTGSTLDLNGRSQAMNGLNCDTNTVIDNSGVGAATLVVGGNGDNSTNNAFIQNTGGPLSLQANGGTVSLSPSNSYTGGSTFNGAQLSFPSAASLGSGPITFNPGSSIYSAAVAFTNALTLNGAYLHVGGGNLNVQNWSGPITVVNGFQMAGDTGASGVILAGPINIGTGGISITNTGGNGPQQGFGVSTTGNLLSGVISGSGGITYNVSGGNSRLTVQGANTYTGGTIVNGDPANPGGKLNVWGSVNPFSTGSVTLNANAIIEAAPGTATITNALTLNGGTLQSEPQYNNYNQLKWSGPITLTADSALLQNGSKNSTGSGDNQSAGVVVSGPINIGGFTLGSYGNFNFFGGNTISGPISGTGNIIVTNNQLVTSGTNSFSGTFRAVGGTLNVQNVYALQNATLDMNAADAGAVNLNNLNVIIGALTGTRNLSLGTGTASIGNNNASTTYTGTLTGNSLIKLGMGVLTLSFNAYTGNTSVSGGTLSLAQPNLTFGSTVTVAAGAVLNLNFNATNVVSALVLNGVNQANGIYNSANSGGLITGPGAIQVGINPDVWTGAFSGDWTTNILSSPKNWTFNSAPVDYADGQAVLFDDTLTGNNTVNVVGNVQPATVTFNNSKTNYVLQGNGIAGTAGLTKNGTNNVTLLNNNLFTGNMAINAGSVTMGVGGNLGGGTYAGAIAIATNATLEFSENTAQTLSGGISGAGTLAFDSASATTMTLSGNNTYSGPTLLGSANNVNLKLFLTSAASVSPNTAYNILGSGNTGGSLYLNASGTYANSFSLSGAGNAIGAIVLGPGVNLTGPITLIGDSQIAILSAGTTSSTLSGRITGSHGLAFNGGWNSSGASGTKTFILANTGAANNYTGTTIIQNNYYSPATYTSATTTILQLGANEQIPNGTGDGLLTFQNGNNANRAVTFELNGFNETINGTSVASAANTVMQNTSAGASTLTIGDGDTTSTFPGRILDGGAGKTLAIVKIGAGTLTLSGANTYNGGTTINGGTLLINNTTGTGTGTNAVTVNSGGTLGGTGAIIGAVTNKAGGILSPGVGGIGKLTLNGNVTLLLGSTNTFVVNGSTPTNNSVAMGAAITYGGVLNIVTNGTFTLGQTFQLFSGAGAANASSFASIAGSPGPGLAFSFANGVLSVVSASAGPTLTSVTPNPVAGSSYPVTLNLTGSGFTGATAVLLTNLTTSTGFSFTPTVNSDTSIAVSFVPGAAASAWNATVVNGTSSGQVGFTVTAPTSVSINGSALTSAGAGKLVLSGSGGTPGSSYAVLSTTNLSSPVIWTPVVTNQFDGSGNFGYTNTISVGTPKLFLRIQQ